VKCALCGYMFDEKRSDKICEGCLLAKGCSLVKCPNCGYETPPEDKWLKEILKRRRKKK
jgi:rubredoxin